MNILEYYHIHIYEYFFVVTCAKLRLPSNGGIISYNGAMQMDGRYPVGTVASFSCPRGTNRVGSSARKCDSSGTWTQTTPSCNLSNNNNNNNLFS